MAGYSLKGGQVICIPSEFVDVCMKGANPTFIAVYIYGFRQCYSKNPKGEVKDVAEALGILESDVIKAWKYWENEGVVKLSYSSNDECDFSVEFLDLTDFSKAEKEDKTPKKPTYSSKYIAEKRQEDSKLADMFKCIENMLSRSLTLGDIQTLFSLYEDKKLEPGVIIVLVEYCINYGMKRLSFTEKMADTWIETGITTVEEASKQVMRLEKADKLKQRYGQIFELGSKKFTPSECSFLVTWTEEMGFSDEMLKEACDKTLEQTGELSFHYMNSILQSWHDKGIKTKEATLKEPKAKRRISTGGKTRFNSYSQSGEYSDEDLESIISNNDIEIKG